MIIAEIEEIEGDGVFSIAVLGTCRVRDLWRSCVDSGLANVIYGVTGSTQTIEQASQLFRFINGNSEMPPHVQMLCYDRFIGGFDGFDEDQIMLGRKYLESVDMFAIEISTKKDFVFDGYSLGFDRLVDLIGSDNSGRLLDWFSDLSTGRSAGEQMNRKLNEEITDLEVEVVETGKHFTYQKEIVGDIIEKTIMLSRSEDEVRKQLSAIKKEFGKPIIVIPAPTFSEKNIPEREEIVSILENSIDELGFNLFNPSNIISEFGVENAMIGGGNNENHYEHEFLVRLGEEFIKYSRKIWEDYSEEEEWPLKLSNLVFFVDPKQLAGHEYNDQAGRAIIKSLKAGDILQVSKSPYRYELLVKKVNDNYGGNPTVEFEEGISDEAMEYGSREWRITARRRVH